MIVVWETAIGNIDRVAFFVACWRRRRYVDHSIVNRTSATQMVGRPAQVRIPCVRDTMNGV